MRAGTFDSEQDAARAWDRWMVWCHLHGVVGASGSIRAALKFAYDEYEGEVVDELRSIMTQDAMVLKLQQEGRAQPGSRGCKRARGGAVVRLAGGGGGGGGGVAGGGGGGGLGGGKTVEWGRG